MFPLVYTITLWSPYGSGLLVALSTSVVLRETNFTFCFYTMDNNVLHVFLYTMCGSDDKT